MEPDSIPATIARELEALGEFVALLKREQTLLQAGKTDALIPLIDAKTSLTHRLAECLGQRESALAAQGLGTGKAGMAAWLDAQAAPQTHAAWSKLLALAEEARESNLLNGKLIGLQMQHNQQALAALMAATDRAMIYGPDGQQRGGFPGRILGSA